MDSLSRKISISNNQHWVFTKNFSLCPSTDVVTYRLVVASDDQVFVSPSSDCALIKRMYDSHIRYLLKPKQATLVELHAVAAVGSDADHSPDNKCHLRKETSLCS